MVSHVASRFSSCLLVLCMCSSREQYRITNYRLCALAYDVRKARETFVADFWSANCVGV
jgi:hypothetical protein